MEVMTAFIEAVGAVGFPVACVIVLGLFIFKIYTDTNKQNNESMERMSARCQEREDKLYAQIERQNNINAKFAEIIARYEVDLDEIKNDVRDIKAVLFNK